MTATRGILGRLGARDRRTGVIESVVAHLQLLLNTRVGDSATVPEFGIIDFTDLVHDIPKSIPTIQSSLRATLARFEPRLQNVNVRFVPSADEGALVLAFEITGRLVDERKQAVRLQTRMRAGGRFEIE